MSEGAARLNTEWDALVSMLQMRGSVDGAVASSRVPVTVVGGFLGAGKTTLLRHLLTADHGLRLSVVVNDLGAVNIDATLLASSGVDRIELSNGCSCCTLGPDLARSLRELADRVPSPDAILIEASGVGDPTGIATVVAAEPALRLDGVLTVVDATSLGERLDDPRLAPLLQRQLDAAHLVVLSRPDRVGAAEIAHLTARLGGLAPGRPVLAVEHGRLPVSVAISAAARGARPEPNPVPTTAVDFVTSVIEVPTPIERMELAALLEDLRVLRAKGFVEFRDSPGRAHLVQRVGRAWSIEAWDSHGDDLEIGRLVTITLAD